MVRTFQWLLEDTPVDLGKIDLGTHTQQSYLWGGSTLISNPLPFLYTIFHRRGIPFLNVTFSNTKVRTLHIFLNSLMKFTVFLIVMWENINN